MYGTYNRGTLTPPLSRFKVTFRRKVMGLLEWLFPRLADRRQWRAEEEMWRLSNFFPQRVVRVYRSERQLKRDAHRLRHLGYQILFQATSSPKRGEWWWHVTYDRQ
jgi:hypothetical protein